ncbi:MAG: GspE/PulE/PilB domain-containing protein [bacterium]
MNRHTKKTRPGLFEPSKLKQETLEIDPFKLSDEICRALPFGLIRQYNVVPVGRENGRLQLACECPLPASAVAQLESSAGTPITFVRASKSSIFFSKHVIARRTGQTRYLQARPLPLHISGDAALPPSSPATQANSLFSRHSPFGQHLVSRGLLSQKQLEQALERAIHAHLPLGEYLVQEKQITPELRDSVLIEIERNYNKIFDDYCQRLSRKGHGSESGD